MPGRPLLSDDALIDPRYQPKRPDMVRRRAVLRETLERFSSTAAPDHYSQLAEQNLARWRASSARRAAAPGVFVIGGDWGEVTLAMTKAYGRCFAALNMANAYVPGGAYVEGAPAQEENMFRRTDCHYYVNADEYDEKADRYRPEMTSLLSAEHGIVLLDSQAPRVCIRGPEDSTRSDLGYPWLPDDDVFPFYELRAAAQDLRDGSAFSEPETRHRIAAQLDTLIAQDVRHAVLGAFGCGAFMNPASQVARIYHDELSKRKQEFNVVAFAIFHPGYGPDNLTPFQRALSAPPRLG